MSIRGERRDECKHAETPANPFHPLDRGDDTRYGWRITSERDHTRQNRSHRVRDGQGFRGRDLGIKRDGAGLRKLTSASGDALTPDWSPKGRTILFADDVN